MSLYVIADLHLSRSTEKPMDIFGSRWDNYMEKIEKCWRSTVSDGDTVVVAGDISWAMTPLSSSSGSNLKIPSVHTTAAFWGFLPVANALGDISGAMPTSGIGRLAFSATSLTMAYRRGHSSSVMILARACASASSLDL